MRRLPGILLLTGAALIVIAALLVSGLRLALPLDVWQSLLHMRWQFRDLTFWQLNFRTNTPLQSSDGEGIETSRLSDLFLRQFDHFDLRDSQISFLTLSGQRAELAIGQMDAG